MLVYYTVFTGGYFITQQHFVTVSTLGRLLLISSLLTHPYLGQGQEVTYPGVSHLKELQLN